MPGIGTILGRIGAIFSLWVGLTGMVRADRADDVARIHLEALGGVARVTALSAVRISGHVRTASGRVRFQATAARPDRVRLEIGSGPRTLVQASDGVGAPWEFDTGQWPPHYREMPESVGRTFAHDAEFDDPLVAGTSRGYALEYAGEMVVDEKKFLRINVARRPNLNFFLLLDPESYLIVLRVERRVIGTRTIQVVTRFEEYRPVDGVLLPHRLVVITDGKATQQTDIESIEPNPTVSADIFSRPKAVSAPASP